MKQLVFANKVLFSTVGGLLGSVLLGKSRICGVDDTGRPNDDTASITKLRAEYGDLKYSADANYIIFVILIECEWRNSDQKDGSWMPIHYMENGRTAEYAARCRTNDSKCQGGAEWSSQYEDHKWHRFLRNYLE